MANAIDFLSNHHGFIFYQVFYRKEKGKIQDIKINKHVNGKGKGAEEITKDVIAQQSLKVDTVTGATYSSIAILKAIEQALLQ
ncbi:MAG: FMN-binding protein [Thermotogota bacterium]|nr:FMN-binding protein [Thermotogota bacterium]